MRTAVIAVSLFCLAGASVVAQTVAPKVDPTLRARFGFTGPHVHKVGWGVGLLHLATLDGAEGPAVALVNNPRRARLELLRAGDDGLNAETESTDGELAGLAVGDVDGDGAPDILMLSSRGRITVRVRDQGRELPPIEVGPAGSGNALRAGDFDGDGRDDALVLTRDGLRLVRQIAGQPQVSAADPITGLKIRSFHVTDADGDGALDILLCTDLKRTPLWIQRGRGDGTFGPWLLFAVQRLHSAFPGTGVGGRPTLATIQDAHRRVVESALRRSTEARRPAVELVPLSAETKRTARPFAHGDVDGDGDPDLVLADPEAAEIVFLLERDGEFEIRTAPTLSGIDSITLADIDGDQRTDLLLTSAEEGALAWKSGAKALDAFPERLPSRDLPLAATFHQGAVLYLARDAKRNGKLYAVRRGEDGAFGAAEELMKIGRLADAPLRLLVAELDGQPGAELAYVQPGRGLRVLRAKPEGGYLAPKGGDRAPPLLEVADGAVSLHREGDRATLLAVRPRFARSLRLDAGGEPAVLAQDNGPPGIDQLSLCIALGGGARAYVDNTVGKVWITRPGATARSLDVPRLGATHALAHAGAVLLLTKAGVLRVPLRTESWELHRLRVHEPPTDDTEYFGGLAADLDGDGQRDLAVVDDHGHGVHVLVAEGDRLRRALSFPVFELPQQQGGGYEPHDWAVGDLNGDGRDDLVVVCHDRVLAYLQEE
ncbi:MAG: VCBS repeat-containing protein [Planctomycetota bacterium]